MKKSFKKYEKAGLPGGPNELKRFTQGFIVSERGQWDYPGLPTAVPTPTGKITMKGVEDDLLGIDNLGNAQYMTPGNEYQFEGDMVYEIPQAKKGGSKKYPKKYSRSLMARNILFTKNPLFKKSKSVKNKIFDPNSPYFQDGGITYVPIKNYDPNNPEHQLGYNSAFRTITYNPNSPIENINNPWWLGHELFHDKQNMDGKMSTYGSVGLRPNPYVASDEAMGAYYDRRGVEFDQAFDQIMQENPDMPEEEILNLAQERMYMNPSTIEGEARQEEQRIESILENLKKLKYKKIGGEIISFDFDDTLSTDRGLEMAQSMPNEKYIISARAEVTPDMIERARAAGISEDRIFATGSDKAKIAKIKELGINRHIDNKQSVINKLGSAGQIFQDGVELPEASYGYSVGNLIRKQPGGETDAMNAMMKARLAYANEFGNPAAQRMIVAPDNPYDFGNGMTGTHYMASMDNYAVPQIQDENGQLVLGDYGPESNEAIRFDRPEDAEYFAKNYKNISPGFIELELDDNQIEEYRKGGYIIEDISIPSLTRMDNGGNPIKQLQEKEKAAELSRLIASGAAGGLGNMANYITKAISESENKSKPSSNVSAARATAKPKSLAAVEKLTSAPKTKPGEVNLAVRDFVQDAKEIDLKSKKDPYEEKNKIIYIDGDKMELKDPDADARYKQWVMNIEDKNKNQTYLEDFGDWINENIFGAESDIESAYRSIYNPVKPKTYYYNGRQVTGNGPWNNYGDAPVQMAYPEMFFMGPSGGAAGIASNALKSGSKYAKNVIWPALNTALPLGEGITTATAGTVTPFNIASLIFGSQSAANLADPNSESRKSLEKAYNNPTTSNILDAVGNVGLDALGILGSPGVTNMFGSAAGGIGKLFAGSDDVIPNTEKLIKGLEKVPGRARPTNEQFKAVIDKNINYIKSPEYKKLRMQNTGETSTQVDKAVSSYVKKLNKTKLTSNKDDLTGKYSAGNLVSNPSINVDPYSMTPERYLSIFDHELKHALSPLSGRGRYSLYKNYPILKGTPEYKEPSLKEVFFGEGKSPKAIDQQAANYYSLPEEQQVRALRLKEKMKQDLGVSAETPLTEDDVYNWMSNYKYSLPEELGDVDDLLKSLKVGSGDAMEKTKNITDWMNKAWMLAPGAGVAGAAAYGANDGANYKSGGLIETNDNGIVSELTEKEIDKLVKQGYIVEDFSTPSLTKARTGMQMSGLDPAFQAKAQQVANNLGVSLEDLIGIMNHESGLNPAIPNPYTGAVGLIQFMPNTAKGLGTSIEALKNMSAIEQLDYVEKFYKPIAGKAKDIGDLYMYTFLPAAVGKPDDFVLGASGSGIKVFGINQDALYNQNKVFDADKKGYYTVGDVKRRIAKFSGRPLVGSSNQSIPGFESSVTRTPGEKTVVKTTIIKDMQNDDWQPRKEEEQVDPRIEQLKTFTKIIEPSLQNINNIYAAAMQQKRFGGNTRMFQDGGMLEDGQDQLLNKPGYGAVGISGSSPVPEYLQPSDVTWYGSPRQMVTAPEEVIYRSPVTGRLQSGQYDPNANQEQLADAATNIRYADVAQGRAESTAPTEEIKLSDRVIKSGNYLKDLKSVKPIKGLARPQGEFYTKEEYEKSDKDKLAKSGYYAVQLKDGNYELLKKEDISNMILASGITPDQFSKNYKIGDSKSITKDFKPVYDYAQQLQAQRVGPMIDELIYSGKSVDQAIKALVAKGEGNYEGIKQKYSAYAQTIKKDADKIYAETLEANKKKKQTEEQRLEDDLLIKNYLNQDTKGLSESQRQMFLNLALSQKETIDRLNSEIDKAQRDAAAGFGSGTRDATATQAYSSRNPYSEATATSQRLGQEKANAAYAADVAKYVITDPKLTEEDRKNILSDPNKFNEAAKAYNEFQNKELKKQFEADQMLAQAGRYKPQYQSGVASMIYPEMFFMGPGLGAAGKALTSGINFLGRASAKSIPGLASIPGATIGNLLGAGFAADAVVNRLLPIPGQLQRGEYAEAATNALTGALDVGTAGLISPIYKGARSAASELGKFLELPGSPNTSISNKLKQFFDRPPGPLMILGNYADDADDAVKAGSKFESEIDWGKWNPDTPKYPELINEYNAIEESTKKAGTWMKNPDGSPFQGTPEQFIQQQSSWFKKAFPEGAEKTYRGTWGEMNTERLAEVYPEGRGIFTGDLNTAKHYATSKGKLNELYHPKSKNSYEIDVKGRSWREVPIESLPEMTSDRMLLGKPVAATDDIATWAEKNNVDYVTMKNIYDGLAAKYSRIVNNKPGNFLKSAIGNVGFFDMTNPNVYKSVLPYVVPIGLGAGVLQQEQDGGMVMNLSDKEINQYRKGGWIVEEID